MAPGPRSRRRSPWILLRDGQRVELSNWSDNYHQSQLGRSHSRIQGWAALLRCSWVECPQDEEFKLDPEQILRLAQPAAPPRLRAREQDSPGTPQTD